MNSHRYIGASGPSEFVRIRCEGSWFDSGCPNEEYMVNFFGRYRELHEVTVGKSTVTSRTEKPVPFIVMLPAGFT